MQKWSLDRVRQPAMRQNHLQVSVQRWDISIRWLTAALRFQTLANLLVLAEWAFSCTPVCSHLEEVSIFDTGLVT